MSYDDWNANPEKSKYIHIKMHNKGKMKTASSNIN